MTTEHSPDDLEQRLTRELRSAALGIGLTPGSEVAVVATGRRRLQRRRQASAIALVAVIGAGTALTIRQLARNGDSSIATDTPTTDVTIPSDSAVPQPSSVTDPAVSVSSVPGSVPFESTPPVASTDIPSVQVVDSNMVWTVVTPDSTAAVAYGDSSAQIPGVMLATAPGRSDDYVPQFWRSDDGVTWTPVEVDLPFGSPNSARFIGDSVYAVGTAPGIAKSQPNPLLFGVSADGGLTWDQVELPVDTNDAHDLPYVADYGSYASVYPIDGGAVIWLMQGAQLDYPALAALAGIDASAATDGNINATPEGLYVQADPSCTPNTSTGGVDSRVRIFATETTVVGNGPSASVPSQIGGCDTRLISWDELGVPAETIARAFNRAAREFRVIGSEVTELEVPDGVIAGGGLAQDPMFVSEDGTRWYRMGPDGVLVETDAPEASGYPLGSNATTSFVQSSAGDGTPSMTSILIGASTDDANWNYTDWSDLPGDGQIGYQMQAGVTGAGLVEVLQVSEDTIAAQGGVSVSTGGYTVSRTSARSPIVITDDATGEQVDLSHVWYGENGVIIVDDAGNEVATLDGPTFQSAINDPALGSDPDDYMVAVSADGAHASLESISELLGVDASQISYVPRISSVDGKTVIAVTMKERNAAGVLKQLVLVGTPRS